jgi:hypothetical protein
MPTNPIKYFEDKFVTVITGPCNRNFKEEAIAMGQPMLYPKNLLEYFTGVVLSASDKAIVLEHPLIKTRAYFVTSNIIGIVEEQVIHDEELAEQAKKEINQKVHDTNSFKCPSCKVSMKRSPEVAPGTDIACPKCNANFKMPETGKEAILENPIEDNSSPHIDINSLSQLAEESKGKE